jgi:hypothetical protein
MLHVLNGDATRMKLEGAGVSGEMTVWADVLHDGPVPDLAPDEFRRVRSLHLSLLSGHSAQDIRSQLERWDAALERFRDHDEVVFWFEHDLFDQLALVRHLHWLSTVDRGDCRFTLICIGAFPGVEHFTGLGPLSPGQLASLFPSRVPLTAQQIALGRRVWDLFRGPDPRGLAELATTGVTAPLPFLQGALRRHIEDFPSTRDGLGRSERQILIALGEKPLLAGEIFAATQRMEERVFMGDSSFWSILRRLARSRRPLVHSEHVPAMLPRQGPPFTLTESGKAVLAGEADHIVINGLDRWMGGVHLTTENHWRRSGDMTLTRS